MITIDNEREEKLWETSFSIDDSFFILQCKNVKGTSNRRRVFHDDYREECDALHLDILQYAALLFFCPSNANVSSEPSKYYEYRSYSVFGSLTTFIQKLIRSYFTEKLSTLVITNIEAYQPNNSFEKAIIAVPSFFVDKKFKIEINIVELNSGLQPPPWIPNNWRTAIGTINVVGIERKIAGHYVQVHDQRFTLTFS